MWTDNNEPVRTTFVNASAVRERARSKKRHKPKPRSKLRSGGAPASKLGKSRYASRVQVVAFDLPIATAAPVGLAQLAPAVLPALPMEAPGKPVPQTALIIGAEDQPVASLSEIEQDETSTIDASPMPAENAATPSADEAIGAAQIVVAPSSPDVTGRRHPDKRGRLGAVGLVGGAFTAVGLLLGVLWLPVWASKAAIDVSMPIPGQAVVADPPRSDAASLRQDHAAIDVLATTPQAERASTYVSGEPIIIEQTLPETASQTTRWVDVVPTETATVGLLSVVPATVHPVPIATVPLPPRRPGSPLARRIPATPSTVIPAVVAPDPIKEGPDEAKPLEAYASFASRKHEIGLHQLAWGAARLHEDANGESGRGPTWEFVTAR